jgi:diadenosine tetraphosphate (Ap4A) HIT family hydrolase
MGRSHAKDSITLVACCGPKLTKPAPAADLFVSSLFKKDRTHAERRGRWFVLSALHGLVDPTEVIAPYDVTLNRIRLESEFAVAFPDAFPVTAGHTLVVPKRHVTGLFDLPEDGQAAVWALVTQVRALLLAELKPDGFNVGVNDGRAAGQTVLHAHVHVIPRRVGDVADPRGVVR